MKIQDIPMTVETVNAGLSKVLLAAKAPYWDYKDKERTTQEPVGVRYSVALPGNQLTNLDVKIPGRDTTQHLTNEVIAARNAAMDSITVEFIGSAVKLYIINGEQIVSASASAVKLVDDEIDFGKGVI